MVHISNATSPENTITEISSLQGLAGFRKGGWEVSYALFRYYVNLPQNNVFA